MKTKAWPSKWKLPKDAAAILFNADGSTSAHIPNAEEYAPDSPAMSAVFCMIMLSDKMAPWRARFMAKQFKDAASK